MAKQFNCLRTVSMLLSAAMLATSVPVYSVSAAETQQDEAGIEGTGADVTTGSAITVQPAEDDSGGDLDTQPEKGDTEEEGEGKESDDAANFSIRTGAPQENEEIDFSTQYTDVVRFTTEDWGGTVGATIKPAYGIIDLSDREEVILEEGVFANNPNITEVRLPNYTWYVGENSFDNCTNLKKFKTGWINCYMCKAEGRRLEADGIFGNLDLDELTVSYIQSTPWKNGSWWTPFGNNIHAKRVIMCPYGGYNVMHEDDDGLPQGMTYFEFGEGSTNHTYWGRPLNSSEDTCKVIQLNAKLRYAHNGLTIKEIKDWKSLQHLVCKGGIDSSVERDMVQSNVKFWVYKGSDAETWCINNTRDYGYIDSNGYKHDVLGEDVEGGDKELVDTYCTNPVQTWDRNTDLDKDLTFNFVVGQQEPDDYSLSSFDEISQRMVDVGGYCHFNDKTQQLRLSSECLQGLELGENELYINCDGPGYNNDIKVRLVINVVNSSEIDGEVPSPSVTQNVTTDEKNIKLGKVYWSAGSGKNLASGVSKIYINNVELRNASNYIVGYTIYPSSIGCSLSCTNIARLLVNGTYQIDVMLNDYNHTRLNNVMQLTVNRTDGLSCDLDKFVLPYEIVDFKSDKFKDAYIFNYDDARWLNHKNMIPKDGVIDLSDREQVIINQNIIYDNPFIKQVILPDNTIVIGDNALGGCRNLTQIRYGYGDSSGKYVNYVDEYRKSLTNRGNPTFMQAWYSEQCFMPFIDSDAYTNLLEVDVTKMDDSILQASENGKNNDDIRTRFSSVLFDSSSNRYTETEGRSIVFKNNTPINKSNNDINATLSAKSRRLCKIMSSKRSSGVDIEQNSITFDIGSAAVNTVKYGIDLGNRSCDIDSAVIDGDELDFDEFEYYISTGYVRLNRDYLNTLSRGEHTVEVTTDKGEQDTTKLIIIDSRAGDEVPDINDGDNNEDKDKDKVETDPTVLPVITFQFFKDRPKDVVIPFKATEDVASLNIEDTSVTTYTWDSTNKQLILKQDYLKTLNSGQYRVLPKFASGKIVNNIILEVYDAYADSLLPQLSLTNVDYIQGNIPLTVYMGTGETEATSVDSLVYKGIAIDAKGNMRMFNSNEARIASADSSRTAEEGDLFYIDEAGKLIVTEDAVRLLGLVPGSTYALGCTFNNSVKTASLNRAFITVYNKSEDIPAEDKDAPTVDKDKIDEGTTGGGSGDGGNTGSGDGGNTGDSGNTGSGDTGNTGDSGNTGSGDSGNTGSGDTGNTGDGGSTGGDSGSGSGGGSTGDGGNTGSGDSGAGGSGSGSGDGTGGNGGNGSGSGTGTGSGSGSGSGSGTGTGSGSGSGSGSGTGTGSGGTGSSSGSGIGGFGSGTGGTGSTGSGSGSGIGGSGSTGAGTGSGSTGTGNGTGNGNGNTGSGGSTGSGSTWAGTGSGSTGSGDTGSGSGTGSTGSSSGSTGSSTGSTGTGSTETGSGTNQTAKKLPNAVFVKKLPVGSSYQIRLINRHKAKSYAYKSSNKKVATVNSKGLVKIKSEGKAVIKITAKNKKNQRYVYTVIIKAGKGTSVKDTKKNLKNLKCKSTLPIARFIKTVRKGSVYRMVVKSDTKVKYRVSNKRVATVNSKGKIKAIKKGKTHITAVIKQDGIVYKYKILLKVK